MVKRRWTKVQGVELHWVERGEGKAVVLLHGLTDWHGAWTEVAERLAAQGRRVLTPDLPGHGLSGREDVSYALDWNAKVLAAWLDEADVDELDLVGHSYGGGVAQMLLLERAARVRRLALVAPGGLGKEVSLGLRFLSLPSVVEQLGQPFMGPMTHVATSVSGRKGDRQERFELAWANARPGSARAMARTVRDVIDVFGQRRHFLDRAHEVPELPPVAVFWGDRDRILPFEQSKAFADRIEGVKLFRLRGAGHYPHLERPDTFVAALSAFLGAPAPSRPRIVPALALRKQRLPWYRRLFQPVRTFFRRAFAREVAQVG